MQVGEWSLRMLFVHGPSADGHATADWRHD